VTTRRGRPLGPAQGEAMRGDQDPWTFRRVSQLQAMWAQGATAEAIASQLDVSRSAVLGKIYRLRRLGAPAAAQSKGKQNNTTLQCARSQARPEIPVALPSDAPLPTSPARRRRNRRRGPSASLDGAAKPRRKGLMRLTNETCRWLVEAALKWAVGWTLSHFQ